MCAGFEAGSRPPLKPKARLGLLLLRGIPRVRVRFARNCLLRFRRLTGGGFFIGSATAEDHRAASEKNQTDIFHAHINNRRASDFQQRYRFSGAWRTSGLRGDSFVTCTVSFEKGAADFGQAFLGEREVLMQAVFKNVADASEIQIVTEAAGESLSFISIICLRRAGDTMKSRIERLDAEADGPGKFGMGDQKLRYFPGRDLPHVNFAVSLERAARFQDRHPLNSVDIATDSFSRRQKQMIFHIENSRSVVGALK